MHSFTLFKLLLLLILLKLVVVDAGITVIDCDIFVAGGSTASLASAITAAEINPSIKVCLTDPTDWPGGQLTASSVSAIDYGTANSPIHGRQANLPKSFRDLISIFPAYSGGCWVSSTCFQAVDLLQEWIFPKLNSLQNLKVFLNTVIVNLTKDSSGIITSVVAIQRTPQEGTTGWELPLSETIEDWYSASNSSLFTKKTLLFVGFGPIIEATELGDILMLGELPVAQGIEYPTERDQNFIDTCGQANTIPFYIHLLQSPPHEPWRPPTGCCPVTAKDGRFPKCCNYSSNVTWERIWTYRRSVKAGSGTVNLNDVSLQVWETQDSVLYLFVPLEEGRRLVREGRWNGGLNLTALKYSEERSYGWFNYFVNAAPAEYKGLLVMNRTLEGTGYGLSKMPYLRDTRRSAVGITDFRLTLEGLLGEHPPADTVAIGQYPADIHFGFCEEKIPSYLKPQPVPPYYIPFRALTSSSCLNLLLAGKTTSQTFFANAATRLHPEEWCTGVASGAAATLMHTKGWNTLQLYENMPVLVDLLNAVGQPLVWQNLI